MKEESENECMKRDIMREKGERRDKRETKEGGNIENEGKKRVKS